MFFRCMGLMRRGQLLCASSCQYLRRLLINGASANLLRSKATNADPWVIGLRRRLPRKLQPRSKGGGFLFAGMGGVRSLSASDLRTFQFLLPFPLSKRPIILHHIEASLKLFIAW